MGQDDSDTYDPSKEWTDDRDAPDGGLAEFGVEAEEGSGPSEEFLRAQSENGYLKTGDSEAVQDETGGLGQFGARTGNTKGLDEFDESGEAERGADSGEVYDPTDEDDGAEFDPGRQGQVTVTGDSPHEAKREQEKAERERRRRRMLEEAMEDPDAWQNYAGDILKLQRPAAEQVRELTDHPAEVVKATENGGPEFWSQMDGIGEQSDENIREAVRWMKQNGVDVLDHKVEQMDDDQGDDHMDSDEFETILSHIEGVSDEAAANLAGEFFSIEDIENHTDEQIQRVDQVGPATVKALRRAAPEGGEFDTDDKVTGFDAPEEIHGFVVEDNGNRYVDESGLERGSYSLTFDPSRGGKAQITHDIGPLAGGGEGATEAFTETVDSKKSAQIWFVDWMQEYHTDPPEDVADVYQPTKEWKPAEAAEQAKQMAAERRRPLPEAEEAAQFDGVDRREIPDSGLSLSDITDWDYVDEERAPSDEEREHFTERMGAIYDPTDEGGQEDETDDRAEGNDPTPTDGQESDSDDSGASDGNVWNPTRRGYRVPGSNAARIRIDDNGPGQHDVVLVDPSGSDEYVVGSGMNIPEAQTLTNRLSMNVTPAEIGHGGDRLHDALADVQDATIPDRLIEDDHSDPDQFDQRDRVEHVDDGRTGVVRSTTDGGVNVVWDNGDSNTYAPDRLTLVDDQGESQRPWSYVNFPDRVEGGSGTWEAAISTPTNMKYRREMEGEAAEIVNAEKRSGGEWLITRYTKSKADGVQNTTKIGTVNGAEQLKEKLREEMGVWLKGGEEYDEADDDQGDQDDDVGAGEAIEFARLDAANDWRDDHPDALHPDDTRRTKTVTLHPDVDEDVARDAGEKATMSHGDQGKKYGQTELSDDEKEKLKRTYDGWQWGTNGFEAMGAKAALQAEGATDWMNYYEPGEGRDGALKNLEAGKEAAAAGQGATATKGHRIDSDPDPGALGEAIDQAKGEAENHARKGCEHGDPLACDELLREYDWSEDEIAQIKGAAAELGEDPEQVYYPGDEFDGDDIGASFEDWARENEPDAVEPPVEELAKLAPNPDSEPAQMEAELSGPALRALKKAWSGYKLARQEHREAEDRAENYARVINGIRAVNGQEPLDFEKLDGWAGGDVMPTDPTEEFPAPEGGQETLPEAQEHGHAAGAVQQTIDRFNDVAGDTYDPTEEF